LGRAAGCALGKPVEGWPKSRIDGYLKKANALPLDDYIPYIEEGSSDDLYGLRKGSTRGNITYMERDDDMDYPVLGLLILEQKGMDFTPRGMATNWLGRMPYQLLYTAESAAYRNFVYNIWPPESAMYRNPYREWIGAQIRADVFGYVTPGWPEKGAELAFRDASISHIKNGIYGEMLVAAMLSAALVSTDMDKIIEIGLSEIPANCRLAEAVRDTVSWCQEETDWERVWDRINEKYGNYNGVHTINNAALVVMGLLFGANDFEAGIVISVRGGWDTDCNGATVGSILGAKFGAKALPDKWVGVLNDRLLSSVRDCNDNKISELAARTHNVAKSILAEKARIDTGHGTPADETKSSLVGTWSMTSWWTGAEPPYTITVKPDLTGILEDIKSGDIHDLSDVKSESDTVSFGYAMDKGGWEVEMFFEGFIGGNTIKGDIFTMTGSVPATGTRV
jgi:ADP-ribosylglycohydrolase